MFRLLRTTHPSSLLPAIMEMRCGLAAVPYGTCAGPPNRKWLAERKMEAVLRENEEWIWSALLGTAGLWCHERLTKQLSQNSASTHSYINLNPLEHAGNPAYCSGPALTSLVWRAEAGRLTAFSCHLLVFLLSDAWDLFAVWSHSTVLFWLQKQSWGAVVPAETSCPLSRRRDVIALNSGEDIWIKILHTNIAALIIVVVEDLLLHLISPMK